MPYKDPQKKKEYMKTYGAAYWKNLSPERKDKRRESQNERQKARYALMSPEEKKSIVDRNRHNYANDPQVRNRRWMDAKTRYLKLKHKVFEKLGNQCSSPNCLWINADGTLGCTDFRCLQIDHVNGGGTKDIQKTSAYAYLKKVLNDVNGIYQLLCANCNWIKRCDRKEYSPGRPLKSAELKFPVEQKDPSLAVPTP